MGTIAVHKLQQRVALADAIQLGKHMTETVHVANGFAKGFIAVQSFRLELSGWLKA